MSFFSLPQFKLSKKSEKKYDSYQSRCQLIITTVERLVQCYEVGDDLISRVKDGEPVD
jgi:hypothetical protein